MKYHARKRYEVSQEESTSFQNYTTYCGLKRSGWDFSEKLFIYDREAFLAHYNPEMRCKRCLAAINKSYRRR